MRTPIWLLIAQYLPRDRWMTVREIADEIPIARMKGGRLPYGQLKELAAKGVLHRHKPEQGRVQYRKP